MNKINPLGEGLPQLKGSLIIVVFPRRIDKIDSPGMNRLQMSPDLPEVTFLEDQAQRRQKLGDLIGCLIGEIRGKGEAEWRLLIHCPNSLFLRF